MSATNRTVEADCISLDLEDPKARARFEADCTKIAEEAGIDVDAVRKVLGAVRARKRKTKRSKGDFYETPAWAIDAVVSFLPLTGEPVILDAGAGNGAISARLAALNPKAEIVGVEKNPELVALARARGLHSVEFVEADFLKGSGTWTITAPDLIIMNPPFSRAFEFIARAHELRKRGGTIAALLRVNMTAGRARAEFHKKHACDVRVLAKRPSFTGGGKTDATEYAWFVWGPAIVAPPSIADYALRCANPDANLEAVLRELYELGAQAGNAGGSRWSVLSHNDKSKRRPRAGSLTSSVPNDPAAPSG